MRKIYRELAEIRKELQVIRNSLEPLNEMTTFVEVRKPYSSNYELVKIRPDEAVDAK